MITHSLTQCHVDAQIYLPNYCRFEEARYFGAGERVVAFDTPRFGRVGMLVCADLWHMELAYALAHDGVDVLVALVASSNEGLQPAVDNREAWLRLVRTYALSLGMFVVFANRCGSELGLHFYGASSVIGPSGAILGCLSEAKEGVLAIELDWAELRAQRIALPFRRDDKINFTIGLLQSIAKRTRQT